MEVRLKRLTVVLFAVGVAALVVSGQRNVTVGNPEPVSVDSGSSVTLHCVLNTENYERVRLSWYFNNTSSSNKTCISETVFNKSFKTSTKETRDGSETEATHLLLNVTDKNSGWYFCRVISEIPSYLDTWSNGTQILVLQSFEYTTYPSLVTSEQASSAEHQLPLTWWIWVVVAVSAFILIVLLITYALLRSRCINSTADDPIYANTRPVANKQPSPRPGAQVDTLKMVSSSQNLRTPNAGRRYDEGKRRQKL